MSKINNKNTRGFSGVSIVNLEHISHLSVVFLSLNLNKKSLAGTFNFPIVSPWNLKQTFLQNKSPATSFLMTQTLSNPSSHLYLYWYSPSTVVIDITSLCFLVSLAILKISWFGIPSCLFSRICGLCHHKELFIRLMVWVIRVAMSIRFVFVRT